MTAPDGTGTPDSSSGTVTAGQAAPLVELGWLLGEIIADVEHVIASGNASYIDRDMLDDYRERAAAIADTAQAAMAADVITSLKAVPGDTVILTFGRRIDMAEAHALRERFAAVAPGIGLAILDSSATAAIAAAAPAGQAALPHPDDLAEQWFDATYDDCDPSYRQMAITAHRAGWDHARALAEQPQAAPGADAARLRALLDLNHKLAWDSGLASERKRVAAEREEHGMEAL